jgi:proteic killer suppression protein
MIRSFRHKGLERFFTKSERAGIDAKQVDRIRRILDRLDAAVSPDDMNLPGWRLHQLKGDRKGTFSVWVSGDRRITFAFAEGDAINVDLEDYH